MRFALWALLLTSLGACAPAAVGPAKAPEPATPVSSRDPQWKQVEPTKQKVPLVPEPAGVPAADASCQGYVTHATRDCAATGGDQQALLQALQVVTAPERDARLACLEEAPGFPKGLLRALRAELAPPGCGDALALPWLEPRRPELDRRIEDTLIALAIAGKLSRLVQQAPELPVPFDKPHFLEFFRSRLKPWIVTQAAAIHDLSVAGARLGPYAKGVVAVEAGLADMRFVSVVRQVSLPKEMADDAEVREAYYASLDEALEPRKARGRDAALVGLRDLSEVGVVYEDRVQRARTLLSQVYSGRRIDALDGLLLPALPSLTNDRPEPSLAAKLPTFYGGLMLASAPLDAALLRAFMEHGLPNAIAQGVDPNKLDAPSRLLWARALLDRGRVYFRAEDFASSARLSVADKPTGEEALLHALAVALQEGPRDASELLLRGPAPPTGLARVAELDALAAQPNALAPLAAFDAAYLLGIAPPQNDPKFWDEQARRFDKAGRGLRDASQRKRATDSARAARDTARALRTPPPPSH